MFKRRLVTSELKRILIDGTSKPVGIGRVPYDSSGNPPAYPYVIVFPRGKGRVYGPGFTDNPWTMVEVAYQIKAVGQRDDQAQALADRIHEVLLGKNSNGVYQFLFNMDDQIVIDRSPSGESPGPQEIDGTMFDVDDEYRFVIQSGL